jgi:DNA repair ATPase RecN
VGGVVDPERANAWQERIARRLAELDVRIAQLRSRRGEFRAIAKQRGSSSDQLSDARIREVAAHTQLAGSVHNAIRALRLSAVAHERAATAHEHLASVGVGNVPQHRSRAAEHRAAAMLDYLTADHAEDQPDPSRSESAP